MVDRGPDRPPGRYISSTRRRGKALEPGLSSAGFSFAVRTKPRPEMWQARIVVVIDCVEGDFEVPAGAGGTAIAKNPRARGERNRG